MVVRTQIALDPEIHLRARKKASAMGISLAEYFRRIIGDDLKGSAVKADLTSIFDLGSSDRDDVSENVDRYTGEAVEADYLQNSAPESKT